jgi:hypothetical protein
MRRKYKPLVPFRRRIQRRLRARHLAREMLRCLLLGGGRAPRMLDAPARPATSMPLLAQLGRMLLRPPSPTRRSGATTLPH